MLSPLTDALLAAAAAAAWAAAAAAAADDPDADEGKLTLSNCFNNKFFWVASFAELPSDFVVAVSTVEWDGELIDNVCDGCAVLLVPREEDVDNKSVDSLEDDEGIDPVGGEVFGRFAEIELPPIA